MALIQNYQRYGYRRVRTLLIRPTALVISGLRRHKLGNQDWDEITWENRSHFFNSADMIMRRALIDHARKRHANGRPKLEGPDEDALDQYTLARFTEHTPDAIIALDEPLGWLCEEIHELATIGQQHYFTSLTVAEIARVNEVSEKTIERRLAESRLVLERKIEELLETAS